MVTGATVVAVMPLRYRKILGDRKGDALIFGGVGVDGLGSVSVIGIFRLATLGADLAIRVPRSAEDEHPPAAHPELPAVTDQVT